MKPEEIYKLMRHLVGKIDLYATKICKYKKFYLEDAETLLISYGSSARTALEAAHYSRQRGRKVGLLELQTIWPFPSHVIRDICTSVKRVIVVEMNMGQVLQEVKASVNNPNKVFLCNRIDGSLITVEDVKQVMRILEGKGI